MAYAPSPAGPSVLVVDDDEALRRLVAQCLTPEGYAVTLACDGAEALGLLRCRQLSPGLILLDWRMPTPGSVFVREYRALPGPHVPIIIFTAAGDAAEVAIGADAEGFLCKPFDVDELIDVVGRYVGPPLGGGEGAVGATIGADSGQGTPHPAAPGMHAAGSRSLPVPRGRRRIRGGAGRVREAGLRRLAAEVMRIRETLETGRASLLQLLEAEQHRRLTPEEAARVRDLRWQSERLRWELDLLRQEFEQLRGPAS